MKRFDESTSHQVGTNFSDGLVAAILQVLNILRDLVSEIEPKAHREVIRFAAAIHQWVLTDRGTAETLPTRADYRISMSSRS
ncbi:hypothetical protein [Gimesia aquarii]|uniref:hypothetical protein n=1 Tax=Gimesia aquarii TaxID=2527964 RepID=UPI0011A6934F|nr:hypothetical protein [Gimesia aquarii]